MKLKRKKINLKQNVTLNTAKMVIINEYPLITVKCGKPTPLGVGWIAI